ncbi:hypothetical protein LR48_Vigan09g011600 [Vigna angularis]|uniref:Uncharacterized protein n=1 Tax=Phaseolus angularis TaxID=3914 RepID=A0A0L9V9A4_PHAAN|nr:hypothetical protein LR48_Vigan09g011600 [Vigna angularis]
MTTTTTTITAATIDAPPPLALSTIPLPSSATSSTSDVTAVDADLVVLSWTQIWLFCRSPSTQIWLFCHSPSTDRCTGATEPDRAPHQTRQSGHRCSCVRSVLRQQPQLRRSLHRHQTRPDLPSVTVASLSPRLVAASRRRCVLGAASRCRRCVHRRRTSHIAEEYREAEKTQRREKRRDQQKHEIKVPRHCEKPISQEEKVSKEKEIKRGRDAPVLVVERAVRGEVGRERSGIRQLRLLREDMKVDMVLTREESLEKRTERVRKKIAICEAISGLEEDRHLRSHQWTGL